MMKRNSTLLLTLIAFAMNSFAQIFFDKNEFVEPNFSKDEFDYNAKAYLTNSSTDPADTLFAWVLNKTDVPSDWSTTVCSGFLCIEEPTTAYNFALKQGDSVEFKLGFAFFGKAGEGDAYVSAYSLSDASNSDTLSLSITARDLVSTNDLDRSSITVYPNPASDKVYVNYDASNYTVDVYDILGNLKMSKNISKGQAIYVNDLASGVYVVRIDGDLSFSKVLQKK
jgi:hypothetical protein